MKKICSIIICLLMFFNMSCASANEQGKVKLIYVHGTNMNTNKDYNDFHNEVTTIHPHIKSEFLKNPTTKRIILKDGTQAIDDEPIAFIWGDMTAKEIDMVKNFLDVSNLFSPKLAQLSRSFLGHMLHDTIWLQDYYNMSKVLDNLHNIVKEEEKKGNEVLLFGYSAGSFITFQYLYQFSPYLDLNALLKEYAKNLSEKDLEVMQTYKPKKTCINAISHADSVYSNFFGEQNGLLLDKSKFLTEYKNFDSYTENYCYAPDNMKGIINFASPVLLFYTSIWNPSGKDYGFFTEILADYIYDGKFFLTVNYKEDPLGFSSKVSQSKDLLEEFKHKKLENNTGFLADTSNLASGKSFVVAHNRYFPLYKKFPRLMAEAFEFAYNDFYGINAKNHTKIKVFR